MTKIKIMTNKILNDVYIFNPYYSLRNDRKRAILCNTPSFKIPLNIAEDEIILFIHPVFAVVFSLFDGEKTLKDVLNEMSSILDSPFEECFKFISPFIKNSSRVGIEYDNICFEFPINILLENTGGCFSVRRLKYQDYFIEEELDLVTPRLFEAPTTISLLVNTVCATDCIYCYVDRRIKNNCQIPIERLKELIREAKQLNIINFDISGTEIFMYKHWEELIKELIDNGYYPYLSTKLPISEEAIIKLKNIGIKHLQLSIDTLDPKEAKIVNKTKNDDYLTKMFNTLKHLEKHKIIVAINAVITKYNSSFSSVKALLNKLNEFTNIEVFTVNPAERSLGCSDKDFDNFKNSTEELESLENYINIIRNDYNFRISFSGYTSKSEFIADVEIKRKKHEQRSMCSANISQVCILSDGQVTICEELYWNKKFIIGNVLENSIEEIWKSERAIRLSKQNPCDFSDESICKTCPQFEDCRNVLGVCWSDVLAAYGEKHWDYPSPYCPYAPLPIYSMHHD